MLLKLLRPFCLKFVPLFLSLPVSQLCLMLCDPMDCSLQAPLSMGVSRQEYWSGVPLPSPTHSSRHVYFSFCPSRVKGGVRFSFSSNPSFHRHPFASSVTENNGEKPHPSFLSNIVNCTMWAKMFSKLLAKLTDSPWVVLEAPRIILAMCVCVCVCVHTHATFLHWSFN